jgi:hypothetical protein
MRAPNGRTYRITGPAGATDAQVRAKILEQFPESGKRRAAPRNRGTGIGAVDTALDNINEILIGVPEGAYNLAAMVTDPISGMIFGEDAVKQAQAQRRAATDKVSRTFVTQPRPLARDLGRSIAPAGAVSRAATMAAPVVSKIPVVGDAASKVLTSTASGGIGVKGGSRAGRVALRAAGGGTSGAGTAALMGQDPGEGFLYGAGIPILGSIIKRIGGKAVDLRRMPAVKAGQIIRESLGKNVDAAKAAFAKLSPSDQRLAQQVLVSAGVEPSPFFGIGKIVAREIDPDTPARILAQQEAARTGRLAEAAGGATMEDIRAAVRGERAAVTQGVAPLREEMYRRAGYANEFVPAKLGEAADLERLAAEQSGLNRRMTEGAIGAETRLGQMDDLGDPFAAEAINRQRGIAGTMTQRGEQAGLKAITARERAGDIFDEVDSLAAEGIRPMRAADLISSLQRKMADPEILRGSVEEGAIKGVIRQLEKATDANGMLNPKALGKIRRSGINNIVNKLSVQMGGAPSRTGTPEAAQETVLELRSLIDDTLRRGGGGNLVDEFLQKSEQGYAAVNRGEVAGEAFRLYKQDPTGTEFRALVGGDRPKVVGKIMGGGPENEKIANAFAGDPRRLDALKMSADELQNLNRMNELASLGETAGGNLLTKEQPGYLSRGIRGVVGAKFPAVAFAGQGLNQVQRAIMSPKVQQELAQAYQSGPNMAAAMNEFPTAVRVSEQVQQINPTARNVMAQQFGPTPTMGEEFDFPEFDPESGEPLIDIDYSEGYPVPIYGRVSRNMMRR